MFRIDGFSNEDESRITNQYFRMDKEEYFEVIPNIVLAKTNNRIVISSKHKSIRLDGTYLVMVVPYYDFSYTPFQTYADKLFEVNATDEGNLEFDYFFSSEQLYRIYVGKRKGEDLGLLLKTAVYALNKDLLSLKTLIGDFHCHTIYSDGLETPESLIQSAIDYKLDFIAVTDHNNFLGSVKASEYVIEQHLPITVIHGEEYSSSFTNMHIISLGARQALNESAYNFSPKDQNKILSTLEYTKQLCCQIRKNGGVAVMCHPLWKPFHVDGSRIDVPMSLVKELMKEKVFDAIEIVGGSPIEDQMTSQMQFLWSVSFGALPGTVAYLGSTDSHTYKVDPICGKHFTIVFATENTEEAIINAIKKKETVAVQIVDSANALLYGEPRYCMYAQFYLKKVLKRIQ